jgi:hypothetical protein
MFPTLPAPDDAKYKSYIEALKTASADSNAVALETALMAISSFISNSNFTSN